MPLVERARLKTINYKAIDSPVSISRGGIPYLRIFAVLDIRLRATFRCFVDDAIAWDVKPCSIDKDLIEALIFIDAPVRIVQVMTIRLRTADHLRLWLRLALPPQVFGGMQISPRRGMGERRGGQRENAKGGNDLHAACAFLSWGRYARRQ